MFETTEETKQTFMLKGTQFTLTVMYLYNPDPMTFGQQLDETIKKAPAFFQNAPMVIDISQLESDEPMDFRPLVIALKGRNIVPVGIRGGSGTLQKAASQASLPILPDAKPSDSAREKTIISSEESHSERPKDRARAQTTPEPNQNTTAQANITPQTSNPVDAGSKAEPLPTKLVTTPVRSGQQIYSQGDLIVTAPVSHGAELLAVGHIHVYGPLKGRALAGVHGNQDARIFCTGLDAELISIAGNYQLNDQQTLNSSEPVCIFLSEDRLQIQKQS